MIAYLPDGSRLPYDVYIHSSAWNEKRKRRFLMDDKTCVICKKKTIYPQGHHINYEHLGNEVIETDVITLCNSCHKMFHNTWGTITGITSQQTREHWNYYSHEHTLAFWVEYLHEDILLGGEYKMTSSPIIRSFIDDYFRVHNLTIPVRISEDDVKAFFRNRRLEFLIQNMIGKHQTYEEFLTVNYGEQGKAGAPNERRSEANKQFKDMAQDNCIKARETLNSAQYRYIENLWDTYIITKEDLTNE